MTPLQRPATLKELVIHSLLRWRDRDTLVDRDDEEPTRQLVRPDSDAPPRPAHSSHVFDLSVVPRLGPCRSLAGATPSAFSFSAFAEAELRRDAPPVPLAKLRARRHVGDVPANGRPRGMARVLLVVLVVLAGLSLTGEMRDTAAVDGGGASVAP